MFNTVYRVISGVLNFVKKSKKAFRINFRVYQTGTGDRNKRCRANPDDVIARGACTRTRPSADRPCAIQDREREKS